MATTPRLTDLAADVADLTPIDWAAVEATAAAPGERDELTRLKLLDTIVRAHAGLTRPSSIASWGRFTLHERISQGRFGDVHRAHDRRLDRTVALRLLSVADEVPAAVGTRALGDARTLANLQHPNLLTVYGADRIDDYIGVWTEFVSGRTLEAELADGPLSPDAAVRTTLSVCEGLETVRNAGLPYWHVTAEQISRDSTGRVVLTEFVDADDARCRPPKMRTGEAADAASAAYALGVLLHRLAFSAWPSESERRRATHESQPRWLVALIDRAICGESSRRFSHPGAFAAALRHGLRRRARVAAATTAAVLLLLLVGAAWAWQTSRPLRVIEQTVVPHEQSMPIPAPVAIRGGRIYLAYRDGRYFSAPIDDLKAATPLDWPKGFSLLDANPVAPEFLAIRIAEVTDQELWIVPEQGSPRRVGDLAGETAIWSPDGRQIAYKSEGQLRLAKSDGTQLRRLPLPAGSLGTLRWHPKGDRLRFHMVVGDGDVVRSHLWEVRADGSGLRQLLAGWNDPPDECCGGWTPDGRDYLFMSMRDGRRDLWSMAEHEDAHGSLTEAAPIQLTFGPQSFGYGPVVGPDGYVFQAGSVRQGQLVRFDLEQHRFVPYMNGLSARWLAFSPDGTSVAYVTYPEGKLFRMRVDGTERVQLVHTTAEIKGLMWSPDGRWLSFLSTLAGMHFKIFVMPAGGGTPTAISPDDRAQGVASWSKDSTRLVFGDVPARFGIPDGTERIHVYDINTRELSSLPDSDGLWTARWAPNGRQIAAVHISLPTALSIYDVGTRQWHGVPSAHHIENLTWSTDSAFIYYNTSSGPVTLHRVRVRDGRDELLSNLEAPNWFNEWSGLTPDGHPLLLRDLGTSELYRLRLGRPFWN